MIEALPALLAWNRWSPGVVEAFDRVTHPAVALAALLIGYLLARCQDRRLGLLLAAHVGAITLGYSVSLLVGMLVICYVTVRPFRDLDPGQMRALEREVVLLMSTASVLTLTGVLLGCFWAKDHLGRYWGWDPKETWAAVVLVWDGVLLSLLATRLGQRRVLHLAILGNSLVAVAWFVGVPHLRNGLIVFTLTQLLLFGAGYLPAGRLRSRGV